MTRRTKFASLLSLGGALLLTSVAFSQGYPGSTSGGSSSTSGGSSSYPGSSSGGGGGANDLGSVSSSSTTTDVTTQTSDTKTVPNTGGEPLLMTLFGSLTAGSALMLRRKIR